MGHLKTLIIIIVIFCVAFLFTPVIELIGAPLAVKDPLKKADAIVVLGGGWENKDQLSKSTMERYKYGMKLFQKGYGKYIIFSGGNLTGEPTEAHAMAEMALADGFPSESIIVEDSSETTWQNTLFVKKILLEKQLKTVILVTSPYHSLRARTMFKDKEVSVMSAPVPNSEFYTASGSDNLRMAKLVFSEYAKLALYKLNITR